MCTTPSGSVCKQDYENGIATITYSFHECSLVTTINIRLIHEVLKDFRRTRSKTSEQTEVGAEDVLSRFKLGSPAASTRDDVCSFRV